MDNRNDEIKLSKQFIQDLKTVKTRKLKVLQCTRYVLKINHSLSCSLLCGYQYTLPSLREPHSLWLALYLFLHQQI